MIRSMTAFARVQCQKKFGTLAWELKTLNSRYLDISFRLPDQFKEIESELRELIRCHIFRGKLDVVLRYQPGNVVVDDVYINRQMVEKLQHALHQMKYLISNVARPDPVDILRWPGVLQVVSGDYSVQQQDALVLFEKGLQKLKETRQNEGEKLKQILLKRVKSLDDVLTELNNKLPKILTQQRERFEAKLKELKLRLDPERVEQEIVLLLQRADVAEELDRLRTHIEEVERLLHTGDNVGRRLDFLMQELNREANTLASKSLSMVVTQASVELKVFIEQMREQIQNIE